MLLLLWLLFVVVFVVLGVLVVAAAIFLLLEFRSKMDPNRLEEEAAQGNQGAVDAYRHDPILNIPSFRYLPINVNIFWQFNTGMM